MRSKSTNLSFLDYVETQRKRGWTLDLGYKFIDHLKKTKKRNLNELAKITGLSTSSCALFYGELKKAKEKGYSLEKYFQLGRPFRTGKKVLASTK